jgi:hypothetical protein
MEFPSSLSHCKAAYELAARSPGWACYISSSAFGGFVPQGQVDSKANVTLGITSGWNRLSIKRQLNSRIGTSAIFILIYLQYVKVELASRRSFIFWVKPIEDSLVRIKLETDSNFSHFSGCCRWA